MKKISLKKIDFQIQYNYSESSHRLKPIYYSGGLGKNFIFFVKLIIKTF